MSPYAVIFTDLGKSEKSLGLTFVALSRVKHYTDYFIEPFFLDRLHKISNSTSLRPRLKEKKELNHWDHKKKDKGNFFLFVTFKVYNF